MDLGTHPRGSSQEGAMIDHVEMERKNLPRGDDNAAIFDHHPIADHAYPFRDLRLDDDDDDNDDEEDDGVDKRGIHRGNSNGDGGGQLSSAPVSAAGHQCSDCGGCSPSDDWEAAASNLHGGDGREKNHHISDQSLHDRKGGKTENKKPS